MLRKKKALVTGGTGFIGSNLVRTLDAQGWDVIVTGSDAEQKLSGFRGPILQPTFHDIDWEKIGSIDVLFHQAAITDTLVTDREKMFFVNVEAVKPLFASAVNAGCRRIVYASSTAVYGNVPAPYREDGPLAPLNPYGESKKALDEFAMRFAGGNPDTIVVGLRYCNVYGPGESHKGKMASMVYQLARQMKVGDPKIFKYGEQRRDYIYVKDAVRANLLAAQAGASGTVNCGFGKARTFNDVIATLNRVMGTTRKPVYIDNPYAATYQTYTECDMTRAKELIEFVPEYDLERGISDYAMSGALS